jgi:4-hydroxy-2-oxoheptanedioate aldolase
MRSNKLRQLLTSGTPSIGTRVNVIWPGLVEVLGHTGKYDYVEFLAEYSPYDLEALNNFCRAAELYDMGTNIKIDQEPRGFVAQRAIGAGFQSVLFADCRTADDVRHCVRVVRPETTGSDGIYGVGPRRFAYMGQAGTPEYIQALKDVVVMIMIEKKTAVDQLEEILSIEGVDMIQWGGSDYSMSVGMPGQRNAPEIKKVELRVIETALKMGVQPRAELGSVEQLKYYWDLGVRHFAIGTDLYVLFNWWKENGDALREAIAGLA